MTEKRFKITKSKLVKNAHVIEDGKKQFTFPTLVGDKWALIAYKQALNEISEENEQLKQENQMLKSTIGRNEAYITRLTKKGKWTK